MVEPEPNGAGPEPDITESVLERAGHVWTVRLLGRSRGGIGTGAAPLLLLGFWEGRGTQACGPPSLEHLVVGRTLSELGPYDLETALGRARPHTPLERRAAEAEPPSAAVTSARPRPPGGGSRGGGRMSRRPPRP